MMDVKQTDEIAGHENVRRIKAGHARQTLLLYSLRLYISSSYYCVFSFIRVHHAVTANKDFEIQSTGGWLRCDGESTIVY